MQDISAYEAQLRKRTQRKEKARSLRQLPVYSSTGEPLQPGQVVEQFIAQLAATQQAQGQGQGKQQQGEAEPGPEPIKARLYPQKDGSIKLKVRLRDSNPVQPVHMLPHLLLQYLATLPVPVPRHAEGAGSGSGSQTASSAGGAGVEGHALQAQLKGTLEDMEGVKKELARLQQQLSPALHALNGSPEGEGQEEEGGEAGEESGAGPREGSAAGADRHSEEEGKQGSGSPVAGSSGSGGGSGNGSTSGAAVQGQGEQQLPSESQEQGWGTSHEASQLGVEEASAIAAEFGPKVTAVQRKFSTLQVRAQQLGQQLLVLWGEALRDGNTPQPNKS